MGGGGIPLTISSNFGICTPGSVRNQIYNLGFRKANLNFMLCWEEPRGQNYLGEKGWEYLKGKYWRHNHRLFLWVRILLTWVSLCWWCDFPGQRRAFQLSTQGLPFFTCLHTHSGGGGAASLPRRRCMPQKMITIQIAAAVFSQHAFAFVLSYTVSSGIRDKGESPPTLMASCGPPRASSEGGCMRGWGRLGWGAVCMSLILP